MTNSKTFWILLLVCLLIFPSLGVGTLGVQLGGGVQGANLDSLRVGGTKGRADLGNLSTTPQTHSQTLITFLYFIIIT